jgi:hypothetical protein
MNFITAFAVGMVMIFTGAISQANENNYPKIEPCSTCGEYFFGEWVPRPFEKFLTAPQSPEVLKFIEDQNKYSSDYLATLAPVQTTRVKEVLTQLATYKAAKSPAKYSNGFYYFRDGLKIARALSFDGTQGRLKEGKKSSISLHMLLILILGQRALLNS